METLRMKTRITVKNLSAGQDRGTPYNRMARTTDKGGFVLDNIPRYAKDTVYSSSIA
jgi:hypothetical protein